MSNTLAAIRPELAAEWSRKNNTRKNVWWKCKECGYEWQSVVYARVKGGVLPYMQAQKSGKLMSKMTVRYLENKKD